MSPPSSKSQKSREDWVDVAIAALADGGIGAVRVEKLARDLGVTKGSFYWHFDNRRALHEAILERWEGAGTDSVIEAVEASGSEPLDRLESLWAATHAGPGLEVELALRAWARQDDAVAGAVARVDTRRIAYTAELFRDAGFGPQEADARGLLLYTLLIGEHFVGTTAEARRAGVIDIARAVLYGTLDTS